MTRPLIAVSLIALVAGCSPPAAENDATATNVASEAKVAPKPARSKTPEESFADTVAASDVYEIAAGRLAEQKGTSTAVKSLGTMLTKDHNRSTMELKLAASGIDGGLFVDPSLSDEQQAQLKALESANGAAFDAAFKAQQVAAHTKMVALLENYRTKGAEMPLKSFAYQTLPRLRAHLAKAQAL